MTKETVFCDVNANDSERCRTPTKSLFVKVSSERKHMKAIKPSNSDMDILVDDDDFEFVNRHNWQVFQTKRIIYATTSMNSKKVYLHRFILGAPPLPMLVIDHINLNGLDCRKENLRWTSASGNVRNQSVKTPFSAHSKFIGVYLNKAGNWHSKIRINGKTTRLGTFKIQENAARAYDKAVIERDGDKAIVNFPDEWPQCANNRRNYRASNKGKRTYFNDEKAS